MTLKGMWVKNASFIAFGSIYYNSQKDKTTEMENRAVVARG